jgi:tetratricopeptide (TPR) repeat protein
MKNLAVIILFFMLTSPVFAGANDEDKYLHQGVNHFDSGYYDLAVKDYKRAIKFNPKSAIAYNGLGMCYLKLGSNEAMSIQTIIEDAMKAFNRALELSPDLLDAHYGRGLVSLLLYDKSTAIAEYNFLQKRDYKLSSLLLAQLDKYKGPDNLRFIPASAESREGSYSSPQQVNAPNVNSDDTRMKCQQEMENPIHYPTGTTRMASSEREAAEASYEKRKIDFMNSCLGQQGYNTPSSQSHNNLNPSFQEKMKSKGWDGIALPGGKVIIFDK